MVTRVITIYIYLITFVAICVCNPAFLAQVTLLTTFRLNSLGPRPSEAYMRRWTGPSFFHEMLCGLFSVNGSQLDKHCFSGWVISTLINQSIDRSITCMGEWHAWVNVACKISASICKLISPWTKWPKLRRRHFQMHFHEWKVLYFDSNFTEVCSWKSNWQNVGIGSGSCMAPNRRQAITLTNADPVRWRIYAVLGEMSSFILV